MQPKPEPVPALTAFLLGGMALILALALVVAQQAGASTLAQTAADGQALFQQKCTACHTIGKGTLVGPDLQGVTQRQELAWIKSFIQAPDKMLASDPTAQQLLAQFNNVPMPNLGLTPAEVDALAVYLENPAAAGQAPAPAQPAALALPGGDPARGRLIFEGRQPLFAGGIGCISCHSVYGVGELSGGRLGPDLTQVYRRYGGQAGMAATLASLPFPTMQGIFATRPLSAQEQADLLAFFAQADQSPLPAAGQTATYTFLAIGAAGLLVLLLVLMFYWPRQRLNMNQIIRRLP